MVKINKNWIIFSMVMLCFVGISTAVLYIGSAGNENIITHDNVTVGGILTVGDNTNLGRPLTVDGQGSNSYVHIVNDASGNALTDGLDLYYADPNGYITNRELNGDVNILTENKQVLKADENQNLTTSGYIGVQKTPEYPLDVEASGVAVVGRFKSTNSYPELQLRLDGANQHGTLMFREGSSQKALVGYDVANQKITFGGSSVNNDYYTIKVQGANLGYSAWKNSTATILELYPDGHIVFANGASIELNSTCIIFESPAGTGKLPLCD